jgi:hypothetical protein
MEMYYHHQFLEQLRQGINMDNSQYYAGKDFMKMDPLSIIYKLPENVYEKNEIDEYRWHRLTGEGVNHIVGAFYIKNIQDSRNKRVETLDSVNDMTNSQLNVVNDIMKKINEHKMNAIIEKDFSNN